MRSGKIGLVLLGAVAAGTGVSAHAQTTPVQTTPAQTMPAQTSPAPTLAPSASSPAATSSAQTGIVAASALESGANSFTEGQAISRFEAAGFTNIQGLTKDTAGFWRGRGTRSGATLDVAMDFQGRIAAGPGVAALPSGNARVVTPGTSTTGSGASTAPTRDGTPGNPPSTMTGRAVDRLQGETPRPDGTPGNPAGTAAGRAVDRATGSTPPATPTPSR